MEGSNTAAAVKVANDLKLADLWAALAAGWRDFLAAPLFGLFFAAIYVVIGLLLYRGFYVGGEVLWWIAALAGFPLIAPFTAVGLYEVSRRREAGLPLEWPKILGALRGNGDDQLLMMGGILFVAFSFWIILAHGIFAIFMAESGVGGESLEALMSDTGLIMLSVGSAVGALVALFFYGITVISLPMLVDRDLDFITAIVASVRTVQQNGVVMLTWAVLIAVVLFLSMLPALIGLLVALPVLGHATWHLYRRAVSES